MRAVPLVTAALAASVLCACGGSNERSTTSTQATTTPTNSAREPEGVCGNPTNCSTQTTGQFLEDLKISDASEVVKKLEDYFRSKAPPTASGAALVDSACAPVGASGQFPANTYMCGGINRTIQGGSFYALSQLFNVRSDGSVYYAGAPCYESPSDSDNACEAGYWTLIRQQQLASIRSPSPPSLTITSQTSTNPSAGTFVPPQSPTGTNFASPDHNIGCGLSTDFADCQTQSPPATVRMDTSGKLKQCSGQECLGDVGNAVTLAYGNSTGVGPFKCTSATTGITCTVSGGSGFEISDSGIQPVAKKP